MIDENEESFVLNRDIKVKLERILSSHIKSLL